MDGGSPVVVTPNAGLGEIRRFFYGMGRVPVTFAFAVGENGPDLTLLGAAVGEGVNPPDLSGAVRGQLELLVSAALSELRRQGVQIPTNPHISCLQPNGHGSAYIVLYEAPEGSYMIA